MLGCVYSNLGSVHTTVRGYLPGMLGILTNDGEAPPQDNTNDCLGMLQSILAAASYAFPGAVFINSSVGMTNGLLKVFPKGAPSPEEIVFNDFAGGSTTLSDMIIKAQDAVYAMLTTLYR
jgi:hypothetical protein